MPNTCQGFSLQMYIFFFDLYFMCNIAPQRIVQHMNAPQQAKRNPYLIPFALVCSLFFLWGIANSLNGTLIRHFKFALNLERWQAGIVDSAFYMGYFVMAIPAGMFMQRYGYKRGIMTGLALYITGALLFYPAADIRMYAFFLMALFTIASGLAFLETAANLYVTVLGDKKDAEYRINFAQSFNGISIILGPLIGGLFIFSSESYSDETLQTLSPEAVAQLRETAIQAVKLPYLMIALLVGLVALLFWRTKMPEIGSEAENDGEKPGIFDLLGRYSHLRWGVLAQAANVGAQASLWGYFVFFKMDFSPEQNLPIVEWLYPIQDKSPVQIASFHASFALVLFMLGRFAGTWLMGRMEARKVLVWYVGAAVVFVSLAMFTNGLTAILLISMVYFCQSIMFPTIFALATKGLQASEVKLASSLVVMAIVGGAVMPPLSGLLADRFHDKHMALLVPLGLFLVVHWYALKGYKVQEEA